MSWVVGPSGERRRRRRAALTPHAAPGSCAAGGRRPRRPPWTRAAWRGPGAEPALPSTTRIGGRVSRRAGGWRRSSVRRSSSHRSRIARARRLRGRDVVAVCPSHWLFCWLVSGSRVARAHRLPDKSTDVQRKRICNRARRAATGLGVRPARQGRLARWVGLCGARSRARHHFPQRDLRGAAEAVRKPVRPLAGACPSPQGGSRRG